MAVIGANDEILPALEATIAPAAHAAKHGDAAARDALYATFAAKIDRFCRRIHAPYCPPGCHTVWEADDVAQEAYLVFVALLAEWPEHVPFVRYFLSTFPWRLRDAVYRGVARRGIPPRAAAIALDRAIWLRDTTAEAREAVALLETVAATLGPPGGEILLRHIRDGETLTAIAHDLGTSRRSVTRAWSRTRAVLAHELGAG
jgi:RNA polymerase sigma factor (sigma-70 family)